MTMIDARSRVHSASKQPAVGTPGWFEDPQGLHRLRYFDGSVWTDHVTHFGPTPCRGCG